MKPTKPRKIEAPQPIEDSYVSLVFIIDSNLKMLKNGGHRGNTWQTVQLEMQLVIGAGAGQQMWEDLKGKKVRLILVDGGTASREGPPSQMYRGNIRFVSEYFTPCSADHQRAGQGFVTALHNMSLGPTTHLQNSVISVCFFDYLDSVESNPVPGEPPVFFDSYFESAVHCRDPANTANQSVVICITDPSCICDEPTTTFQRQKEHPTPSITDIVHWKQTVNVITCSLSPETVDGVEPSQIGLTVARSGGSLEYPDVSVKYAVAESIVKIVSKHTKRFWTARVADETVVFTALCETTRYWPLPAGSDHMSQPLLLLNPTAEHCETYMKQIPHDVYQCGAAMKVSPGVYLVSEEALPDSPFAILVVGEGGALLTVFPPNFTALPDAMGLPSFMLKYLNTIPYPFTVAVRAQEKLFQNFEGASVEFPKPPVREAHLDAAVVYNQNLKDARREIKPKKGTLKRKIVEYNVDEEEEEEQNEEGYKWWEVLQESGLDAQGQVGKLRFGKKKKKQQLFAFSTGRVPEQDTSTNIKRLSITERYRHDYTAWTNAKKVHGGPAVQLADAASHFLMHPLNPAHNKQISIMGNYAGVISSSDELRELPNAKTPAWMVKNSSDRSKYKKYRTIERYARSPSRSHSSAETGSESSAPSEGSGTSWDPVDVDFAD
eukprot:TRINITY_DN527_c7_g1_i1.p1 TRINITY_DN527_c7_g1~~TRINITY_DN527_c7_g1_i1.p1  ORF type:complete len:662 (+),score=74.79 TRINITY_DN527_c7_g1_i1:51-2036(+)